MYHRRKIILSFLETLGKSVTAKCIQKYLFLYTRMNHSDERCYDFVPYKYGCFSFVANYDLNMLASQGYISIEERVDDERYYTLTRDLGFSCELDIFELCMIKDICHTYGNLSQDDLIAYTYRKYPYTAINSIIKECLLNAEELNIVASKDKKGTIKDFVLMTLGYEGISVEKYINTLIQSDIHVLCDVRKNAYSQKYGFCKKTLKTVCEGVGIKYIHIPDLGIESEERKNLTTQEDYDVLFSQYEKFTLSKNASALTELKNVIDKEKRVCLLCFERNPQQCHRTRIANAIMRMEGSDYKYIPMIY